IEHARDHQDASRRWLALAHGAEVDVERSPDPSRACRTAVASIVAAHLNGAVDEVYERLRSLAVALASRDAISGSLWEVRTVLRMFSEPRGEPIPEVIDLAIRTAEGFAPVAELAALVRRKRVPRTR
ncbi:MAG: hypothetical protein H0T79_22135, partial [Deltaproteobacteria bacterium]|nr:hypothetical protein [Deltaproteobacteria bacterium]